MMAELVELSYDKEGTSNANQVTQVGSPVVVHFWTFFSEVLA